MAKNAHELSSPVLTLRKFSEKAQKAFQRLHIVTCRDLLFTYPRSYEDRRAITPIEMIEPDTSVLIEATLTTPLKRITTRTGKTMLQAEIADDSAALTIIFFNADYMKSKLLCGEKYRFFGKAAGGKFGRDLINPEVRKADEEYSGEILPIYPLADGLTQNMMRRLVKEVMDENLTKLSDSIPLSVRQSNILATASFAMENIHFPHSDEALEVAKRRLVFGEFFTLSVALRLMKLGRKRQEALIMDFSPADEFISKLPFDLTGAQKKVLAQIKNDLASGYLMNRLIQGDVGSGKTAVAAAAIYAVVKNGFQTAIMAPTEILANQHYTGLTPLLEPLGVRCALLTAATTASEKKRINEALACGDIDFIAGTHAIIESGVNFNRLGLVVCDEQHRFGVEQRAKLSAKGENVHTLVMSATPIPRTLALVIYGDLEISVIDELPPGRQKIETYAVGEGYRERLNNFIRKQVDDGHQVYIVCPLVEESEQSDLRAATEYTEKLKTDVFPNLNISLLHGRMKAKEKSAIMNSFNAGDTDILVSTTVIEVGIDVPNATLMIVENAERFGLSQLHQLRGRVGRGKAKSFCVLVSELGGKSRERLDVMCSTNDGFKIAEADLELRGPGDFFGNRQHGLPEMKIASFSEDMKTLSEAQTAAEILLAQDETLSLPENEKLKKAVSHMLENLQRT